MTADNNEYEDDKPLDPAMEKVRRKLARLMVVSIGIMLVGVMAVLAAVVYKSSGTGGAPDRLAEGVIDIPDGFEITGTAVSETRILFTGTDRDGTRRALSYDAQTGSLVVNHLIE